MVVTQWNRRKTAPIHGRCMRATASPAGSASCASKVKGCCSVIHLPATPTTMTFDAVTARRCGAEMCIYTPTASPREIFKKDRGRAASANDTRLYRLRSCCCNYRRMCSNFARSRIDRPSHLGGPSVKSNYQLAWKFVRNFLAPPLPPTSPVFRTFLSPVLFIISMINSWNSLWWWEP